MKRVFLVILDSCGCGELPDAALFGDAGTHTLKHISGSDKFSCKNTRKYGIANIDGQEYLDPVDKPKGAFARLAERSMGKDTTIGHWEISGIISEKPLPTFPDGFPTTRAACRPDSTPAFRPTSSSASGYMVFHYPSRR